MRLKGWLPKTLCALGGFLIFFNLSWVRSILLIFSIWCFLTDICRFMSAEILAYRGLQCPSLLFEFSIFIFLSASATKCLCSNLIQTVENSTISQLAATIAYIGLISFTMHRNIETSYSVVSCSTIFGLITRM